MTCKNCGHPHNEHNLLLADQQLACGGFWFNDALQKLNKPCDCDDCRCDHCDFRTQYRAFTKERGIQ